MMPSPVRGTHLPVLVGGHSRAALRRAARIGDGWYGSNVSAGQFSDLVGALRAFPGGDPLTVGARPGVVAAEDAASTVSAFRDAGADFVVLDAPYAAMDVAAAQTWVHRVADALDLDGSGQPLVARAAAPPSDG
jgi:alkanesulfonate monooxygenase SsuD/methylene tetrahydromethanopterin reductase-like flavin-dependent oxidoreductase (luciferase family)